MRWHALSLSSVSIRRESTVYAALKLTGELLAFIAQAIAILFSVGFMALIAWIVT